MTSYKKNSVGLTVLKRGSIIDILIGSKRSNRVRSDQMSTPIYKNTYTKKERNMYLLGMLGQNMVYNIVGTGLDFYFRNVIFIPAMIVSTFMAIARVWDAINDPMMGTIVDRTKTKWGKCRPYLIFCPAVILVITILCFVNGQYSAQNNTTLQNALIVGWAAISYILWGMSYTVGDIPLWGITSLMTDDEKDRSSILSLSRIAGGIGGGIVLICIIQLAQEIGKSLIPKVGDKNVSIQYGFIIVASIFAIIGCGLFQLVGIFTRERVTSQSEKKNSIKDNFKLMWSNEPFRKVLISSVVRSPIMLLMGVAMPLLNYYFGDYGMKNYTLYLVVLGGAIFIAQFAMSALVPKLCEKYEKKAVYNVSSVVSAVAFALIFVVYLLAPTELEKPFWVAVNFVVFAGAGAGMGALNVMQSILIADAVDYEEYHHNVRPDGVFFSGQSFATKLSSGVASIIQGIAYSIVGFSGDNMKACNTALMEGASFKNDFSKYALVMFFLCSIPPAIGLLLSIIPMKKYPLTNEDNKNILSALISRRHNTSETAEVSE